MLRQWVGEEFVECGEPISTVYAGQTSWSEGYTSEANVMQGSEGTNQIEWLVIGLELDH